MKKKILLIGAGGVAAGIIGTVIAKAIKNHNKEYVSTHKGYPEDDYEDDFEDEIEDEEIADYFDQIIRDLEKSSKEKKKADSKIIILEKKGEQ